MVRTTKRPENRREIDRRSWFRVVRSPFPKLDDANFETGKPPRLQARMYQVVDNACSGDGQLH